MPASVHSGVSGEIDSCEYLYLRELSEPRDNQLRLVIEEATASGPPQTRQLPGLELPGCRAIKSDASSRLFEVSWDTYVAYSIRDEVFATVSRAGEETFSGRFFRIYSSSYFLEYVSKATTANAQHPGPLQHVELVCLNHVIDVVAVGMPELRKLRPGSTDRISIH